MTQEEIREHFKMTAPVFGVRGSSYRYFVQSKDGVWREPGAANWMGTTERDLPAEQKERVRRG